MTSQRPNLAPEFASLERRALTLTGHHPFRERLGEAEVGLGGSLDTEAKCLETWYRGFLQW